MSGRVVHFEIPADDVERAKGFYRDAFGWNLNPMPEMNYTIVSTTPTDESGMPTEPGSINGGMMQREQPLGSPVIVLDVDDIDKSLEKVESLGGSTVVPRQAVGDMGFAAYFKDSEGNIMGLWQNATPS
jgi:uncharacterized protein